MSSYRIGDWHVNFSAGWMERRHFVFRRRIHVDERLLKVLKVLVGRAGGIVSGQELLVAVWPDRVVTPDSVSTAIYELRRLLGDNAAAPAYIRTEARRGYALIAAVRLAPARSAKRLYWRAAAATSVIAIVVFAVAGTAVSNRNLPLQVATLGNATLDETLDSLTDAMDSTLRSALIRRNPGRIVFATHNDAPALRLESTIVSCDTGPVLVVQLFDTGTGRYLWSSAYSMLDDSAEPSLVEVVARDVTDELSRT